VRTEGVSLGMLITVQLDKRDEFDRLWRYAKANLQYTSGARRGYFRSWCSTSDDSTKMQCLDPFGHQQFAMALIFAHNRWGSDPDGIDYEADAVALLDVMQHKEKENGGVVDGVTNTFDTETKLVFDFPTAEAAAWGISRPSNEMPGYYDLWAQATSDPFWSEAAASARAYLKLVAHPETGLMPIRAYFNGTPALYNDFFGSEAYRTPVNMAIDQIWFGVDPWQIEEADRLLTFFSEQDLNNDGSYAASYQLDGTPISGNPERALVVVNGITGLIATTEDREEYVQAAWDVSPLIGEPRYYSGLLHLISLLVLSGQFRVY
jgi:oligosaccharide reducing-end xylanase